MRMKMVREDRLVHVVWSSLKYSRDYSKNDRPEARE